MLAPGTVIDGRFEIVEFLGEGGMGTVYAARHKNMDRTIALKLLKSSLLHDEDKIARFRNEARVLSSLQHPNIISVHAIGVADGGQPYMAMDIVSGESLSEAIAHHGPFGQEEALRICSEICAGLEYAHKNEIVHRDIKPSNIILSTADGGMQVAKLVDFGIAKFLNPASSQNLTQTGVAVGSVFYLSPGQLEGRGADPASDIYALGCTLYEMLTGTAPFQADSFFETALMHKHGELMPVNKRNGNANVDGSVQLIIDRMLTKDHHLRYQSAAELGQDLEAALHKQPLTELTQSPALRQATPTKSKVKFRPPKSALFLACGIALLTAGALVAISIYPHSNDSLPPKISPAQNALDTAQDHLRAHWESKGRALEDYHFFAIALEKADADGSSLLRAHARRLAGAAMRGMFTSPGGSAPKDVWRRCFNYLQESYELSGDGLQTAKDVAAKRAFELEHYRDYLEYAITINEVGDLLTRSQWDKLVSTYHVVEDRPDLQRSDIDKLRVVSEMQMRMAIKNANQDLVARQLDYRPQILKITHTSQAGIKQDFESIESFLRQHNYSSDFIEYARRRYGLD